MDELFGDVLDRGLAPRRRGGFSPAVDVYYASDPPRAVVRADLAGHRPERGRSSRSAAASSCSPATARPRAVRRPRLPAARDRARAVPARRLARRRGRRRRRRRHLRGRDPDRRAAAQPARAAAHRPDPRDRAVSAVDGELPEGAPRPLPGPAAARHGHLPGHADAAGGRPGPLDPARQRRPDRRPDARHARLQGPGPRDARAGPAAHRRRRGRRRAHAQGARTAALRILVQAGQRVQIDEWVGEEPYLVAQASPSCPTRSRRARS